MVEISNNKLDKLENAERFGRVLEQLGGIPLDSDHLENINHIATLSTISEYSGFFPLNHRDLWKHHTITGEVYLAGFTDGFSIIKIVGEDLLITPLDVDSAGWYADEAKSGLVFGFKNKPGQIDRAERIIRQQKQRGSMYDTVKIPLNDLLNHNKIRLINAAIDVDWLEE